MMMPRLRLKFIEVLFLLSLTGLASQGQTVTATSPTLPANLTPMAKNSDQTRCVATPIANTPRNIHMDCKIGTRVTMTVTAIYNDSILSSGGVTMAFMYDKNNTKVVHFQASVNVVTSGITYTQWISQGDITWP
jgi:hypothetical protein